MGSCNSTLRMPHRQPIRLPDSRSSSSDEEKLLRFRTTSADKSDASAENMTHMCQPVASDYPRVKVMQKWTTSGYPVVDGKYLDGRTGELKKYTGVPLDGPPTISIYWHNRMTTDLPGQVISAATVTTLDVTECMIRIGNLLKEAREGGKFLFAVDSINATTYSVNVIMMTTLLRQELWDKLSEHGLTR